ncbi:MAG: tetratricopeptide repeat protein [Alphaproteobacteria bacterium]|nr:tetratricopeptide repeat protein [Alphaproteobacteria bacterium]
MRTEGPPGDATLQVAFDLHQQGDFSAALAIYRALLQTYPDNPQVLGLLGSACRMTGESEEAVECLRRAVAAAPLRIDLKAEYGIALAEAGEHARAIDLLEDLLPALAAQKQDAAVVYAALGDACLGLERLYEAVGHYRTAIAKEPENTAAAVNLGTALQRLGRHKEAIAAYEAALRLEPSNLGAMTNLGVALQEFGQVDDSLAILKCAAALAPSDPGIRTDLAVSLLKAGDSDGAEEALNRAIASDSGYGRAWSNLGNLLQSGLLLAEARMAHESALTLDPDDPEFHWNHSITLLLDGALKDGFAEYEWRRKIPGFGNRHITGTAWDGSKPRGRTILVYAEQGLGDTLQFCRYAPLLARAGAKVVLACPEKLAPLLSTLDGPVEIVSNLDAVSFYDCQAPLMSLPHLMGTTLKTIPVSVPYLSVPPGAASPLPASQKGSRIGLVWAGNPNNPNARHRSMPLEALRPLFALEGIEWISLQEGPARKQILGTGLPIADLAPDLSATAAAMAELDLVITVDTAIAHLAGALGRPFWLLLSYAPDWRWLLDRDDSPWYPTARLFRQPTAGEWGPVVEDVREQLRAFTKH